MHAAGRVYVVLAVAALSGAAAAHHSFAIYDANDPQNVTGVVEEFRWTNPHSWLFLTVTNPDGGSTMWEIEHGPINMLSRQGWTRTTLERGDRITVQVHPVHDGRPIGRFIDFEFTDETRRHNGGDYSRGTITRVERPAPVPMADVIGRDFNGIWINANGGIHFDSAASSRDEQQPPLRPEYMARWRQRSADAAAGLSTADPTAECLPAGFPRFLNMVFPGEILQAPHQLNWYAEFGEATVRVYLDGRAPPEDLQPSYYGFTTGGWEGNTLVTRTMGLRDDTLVDTTGIPHSDQLTVTMRMSKVTPDFLEVAVTLDDPIAFEKPWSTVKRYARAPGHYYAQEYACHAGNRYRIGADGNVEIVPDDASATKP
jgi:hypothetical protein